MKMVTKGAQKMAATIVAWCGGQPVRLCVLFGSQATGRFRPDSDIDLAIWPVEAPSAQTKLDWLLELEKALNKPVNWVLVSADLDPVLGFEIIRDGSLVYERGRAAVYGNVRCRRRSTSSC